MEEIGIWECDRCRETFEAPIARSFFIVCPFCGATEKDKGRDGLGCIDLLFLKDDEKKE